MRSRFAGIGAALAIAAGAILVLRVSDGAAPAAQPASDPSTTAWVCERYPQRVKMLFASLDCDHPGLETACALAESQRWAQACDALLRYYRQGRSGSWLRGDPPPRRPSHYRLGEDALNDTINVSYVAAKIPRRPDGGIDWTFTGPSNTTEYRSQFNALIHVSHLFNGYHASGEKRYALRMDADIRDWIVSNPYPGPVAEGTPWEGHWAAQRVEYFSRWFYGLLEEPAFTDATRILMLSSVVEHGDLLRDHHSQFGNHVILEMTGLATAGAAWPELQLSGAWIDYATTVMKQELERQVYPDGVQYELTSHYHAIVADQYQHFMELLGHAGRDAAGLRPTVEKMWDYVAYSMRPDGIGLMNNDGYEDFNRPRVVELAPTYRRDDWLFIATNGARGTAPPAGSSIFYPWAGQVVMRSGWDAGAMWAYFEFGPAGKAHWHWDKLHVSAFAFGRPLLVDNGLFHYANDPWWKYFRETTAHNVILVDGHGQKLWEKTTDAALDPSHWRPGPELEVARGTMDAFDGVHGKAVHHRALTFAKDEYWLVVDRIETDRPRDVTALWHFHPDCTVVLDGGDAVSVDAGKGNLRIVPVGPVEWSPRRVRAQAPPDPIQGWYSPKPNNRLPATVAVYDGHIEGTTTFAWVLFPARGLVPQVTAEMTADGRIHVRTPAGDRTLASGLDAP